MAVHGNCGFPLLGVLMIRALLFVWWLPVVYTVAHVGLEGRLHGP